MKGYTLDPVTRKMTFWRGGGAPTLVIPDSFPVLALPDELEMTVDAVYPDVPKSRGTFWQIWSDSNSLTEQWGVTEISRAHVTATPQEWSQVTVLAEAPAGADIFMMQVRLARTVAPSSGWPSGIAVRPVQNRWITFSGSMDLEEAIGFGRGLSIYIDDDPGSPTYRMLVLHQQQSVSVSPGGYGAYGTTGLTIGFDTSGGDTNGSGYPVYYGGDSAPQYRRSDYIVGYPGVGWSPRHRHNSAQAPTTSDPTNFGSTWRIDLRGQFGRRS